MSNDPNPNPEPEPTSDPEPARATDTAWDELFKGEDPAKVREALENSRKWESRAKENFEKAQKFDQLENEKKSETQRLAEERDSFKEKAEFAERLEVVLEKAPERMSLAQARTLAKRLVGSNKEELEADADELLATFGGSRPGPTRPTERLRGGGDPDEEPEPDLHKIAADIPRR